jgi:hypothetical protein
MPIFSVADEETRELAAPERKRKRKKRKRNTKATAAPAESPAPVDKLSTGQISAGIKSNLAGLVPCFKSARKRGEMTPGKHALVIDFRIQPNGSVRDASLTGPAHLASKKVAKCIATKIRTWRFPASVGGSPVRNLQLPITLK